MKNGLWIKHCVCSQKTHTHNRKDNIKSRAVSDKRDRHAFGLARNEAKTPSHRAEHPSIKKPRRLASSTWSKHKHNQKQSLFPPWSTADGDCNKETCHNHMASMFFECETRHVNGEQSKNIFKCFQTVLEWRKSPQPTPLEEKRHSSNIHRYPFTPKPNEFERHVDTDVCRCKTPLPRCDHDAERTQPNSSFTLPLQLISPCGI